MDQSLLQSLVAFTCVRYLLYRNIDVLPIATSAPVNKTFFCFCKITFAVNNFRWIAVYPPEFANVAFIAIDINHCPVPRFCRVQSIQQFAAGTVLCKSCRCAQNCHKANQDNAPCGLLRRNQCSWQK